MIVYFAFFSFFLGHVPDIYHSMKESGNDELPLTVVLQQWWLFKL
jgi:hypothetical protein